MIRKISTPNPTCVRVVFELPSCLWADRIYLVGDFNNWDETATPMHQERDGVWRAVLELKRGVSYEFRYLIDGQWTSDSHADGFAENRFGVSNSVVHASLPTTTFSIADRKMRDTLPAHVNTHMNHTSRTIYPARKVQLAG